MRDPGGTKYSIQPTSLAYNVASTNALNLRGKTQY